MKIGLDLHGVIDSNIEFYRELTKLFVHNGHEVHIITGKKKSLVVPELTIKGINCTHIFSITDHHAEIGTPIEWDEQGNPHMEAYLWDKTKAEYCLKNQIDLHLDDSDAYGYFFKTPYARLFSKDTERVKKTKI